MTEQSKTALVMTLLTLGLYFSGIFIFVTPLPFIYHLLKHRGSSPLLPFLAGLTVVAAVYFFGAGFLYQTYKSYPVALWLVPVPLVELLQYFSQHVVGLLGLTYFVLYLGLSLGISKMLAKGDAQAQSFSRLILWVAGLCLIAGVVIAVLLSPYWQTILASYRVYIQDSLDKMLEAQSKAGMELEQIVFMRGKMQQYVEYSFYMLPFMFLLSVAFLGFLNLVIAKKFFAATFKELKQIDLSEFHLPFFWVWAAIATATVLLASIKIELPKPAFFGLLNFLFSLGILYFLQGMAVLAHFFERKNVSGIMRLSLYFILLVLFITMGQLVTIVITAMGFFDHWLDTRKTVITGRQRPS